MEKTKRKWRESGPTAHIEIILEEYYSQLLKWAALLTRGDSGVAQDIVHDLCLHFTLVKPDLSQVANMDGYLYTCLRHIYLSGLSRSAREAMRFVSVAEFDSIQFALGVTSAEGLMERQNDIRRICSYMVWRKETSKSASYFILHFFHGYGRKEIAEIACLPIAAIYNKLKTSRTEVKSHLAESGKLRIATRDIPPEPELLLRPLSSSALFDEIREAIWAAKTSECLDEEELLARYRAASPKPISCALLSHLVSCEHCLSVVDRHFRRPTFQDRDFHDGLKPSGEEEESLIHSATHEVSFTTLMRTVRRQRERIYEHRPRMLSIAVNGRINAFHDVQSELSTLSARIDDLDRVRFVEVFTEQQVRLALLSVEEHPPEGPQTRSQRVALSDDRWIELNLSFDGLGLHSEVTYRDPALATSSIGDGANDDETAVVAQGKMIGAARTFVLAPIFRYLREIASIPVTAWAIALALVLFASAFFAYRYTRPHLSAEEILSRSINIESATLVGETEHQVLHVEVASADEQPVQRGTIEIWKDGSGPRYIRRLYDEHRRLLAAEWQNASGRSGSYSASDDNKVATSNSPLLTSDLWKQDVSSRAFSAFVSDKVQTRVIDEGYELTVTGPLPSHPQLISATLVLDRRFLTVRETMRVQNGSRTEEVRFVRADYQRMPAASVPDSTFLPEDGSRHSSGRPPLHSFLPETSGSKDPTAHGRRLAKLQIAVLYQLNLLDADTADPIEVVRSADGTIHISGAIADEGRMRQIQSHLEVLPDHQFLDLRLISPNDTRIRAPRSFQTLSGSVQVYETGSTKPPADALVRRYFQAKGLSDTQLDSAVVQFSSDVLETAQRALQSAYALDRLGSSLSTEELDSVGAATQSQWALMIEKHASRLEDQLRSLNDRLVQISPQLAEQPNADGDGTQIDNPAQFAQSAHRLLNKVQEIDHQVSTVFASRSSEGKEMGGTSILTATIQAIPLRQGEEMRTFAERLAAAARSAKHRQ
jgi:DNA-directed RNA polymerase specialized sigma24 family protein